MRIIKKHRKENRNCKYDCIIGASGGKDSTYALYYLSKVLSLRVLAVNFSVGWNPLIAQANVLKAIDALGIDMFTMRIKWEKLKRIYSIFLRHTGGLCISCNILKTKALFTAALTFNVKIIITGVSGYDTGTIQYRSFSNENLKKVLSREMKSKEIEEFLIPGHLKQFKYFHLDSFVKWDERKMINVIKRELGWKNPTTRTFQKGYQRVHHTDCDWFPMDCYLMRRDKGYDRLTISDGVSIRKGEKTRTAAIRREKKFQKNPLPSCAYTLLKRVGVSLEDIRHN